jgi:peptidoglycan/xylan/chitin deacetylase (PgdA/CDA1 family)
VQVPAVRGKNEGFAIEKRFPAAVLESCIQPGTVALTFDDGLTPATRNRLLPFLRKHRLPATFFIIGNTLDPTHWAYRDNVAAVEEAVRDGHIVANHSFTHPDLTAVDAEEVELQVQTGSDAIKKIIGVEPTFFRPPMGAVNDKVLKQLKSMGQHVVGWNCNSDDWKGQKSMIVPNILLELDRARPVPLRLRRATKEKGGAAAFGTGFVMLLHEPQFDEQVMLDVLNVLGVNKLKVVPLDECLGVKPYHWAGEVER